MSRTLFVVLAVLSMSARALAQDAAGEQGRRDLIRRAELARASGDHPEALALGTRAAQMRMTPSLRLLIAQEHDVLGHTLEALDHAERYVREAEADPTLRNGAAIRGECEGLRARIAPFVGRLTVRVQHAPAGTHILLGDHALTEALWNVAFPVMPGTLRIVGTAPDGRHVEQTVVIARGASEAAVVAFPAPTPGPASPVTVAPSRSTGRGAGPWIVSGISVAGFAAAAALWALHDGAITARDSACDPSGCDPSAVSYDARARSLSTATNAALAIGGAAAIGAGLWFVLGGRRGEVRAEAPPRAFLAPLPGGLMVGAGGHL